MNKLYPLKFKNIFKDKIWGGQKINTILGKDYTPLSNCGEMWVVSGVEGNQSIVENGFLAENELNEVVEIYMGDLVGEEVYEKYGNEFPVLIKFIDANDFLSIQVHPDDNLAKKRHAGNGKTEMWYIVEASPEAELISGFSKKVDKETYLEHLQNKTLKEILNFERVKAGDVFYMPAGRVHAIGPGILLAEIQQTSDITYRIYDWDRLGVDGSLRELHTDLALDAIDFENRDWIPNSGWPIGLVDLLPHYDTAHRILELPPAEYDIEQLQLRGIDRPGLFDDRDFQNIVLWLNITVL